jgi:hypothetical protein
MAVISRRARVEDLQRAGELIVCSINELCNRHGFGPIATVRPPAFALFCLSNDPDVLWVAEDDAKSRRLKRRSTDCDAPIHEVRHRPADVRLWHKADMTTVFGDVRSWGVKRTFGKAAMSANDPNRTSETA